MITYIVLSKFINFGIKIPKKQIIDKIIVAKAQNAVLINKPFDNLYHEDLPSKEVEIFHIKALKKGNAKETIIITMRNVFLFVLFLNFMGIIFFENLKQTK